MRIPRKDNNLNDAIEALDVRLEEAKGIVADAWESLTGDELKFIDGEIEKCIVDRHYYIENYHTIRDEHGRVQTLYPAWDHQLLLREHLDREWKERGCFKGIVLKPRQCGGTTWSAAIVFHATIFTEQAYSIMMAHDDDASAEIARRIFDAFSALPWWLKAEFSSKQMERHVIFQRSDDRRRALDPGLGSTLLISNAQKGAGVAIGRTIRSGHFSEVSRWPSAEVWTADIDPSLNARDMLAIMESTAFGRNGLFYNLWKSSAEGKSDWTPIFIPVYKVRKYYLPLRKGEVIDLTDDERAIRDRVKTEDNFTIPLGFFKWRRKKIIATENATGSDETHYESYPITSGEAFIASGLCAFPKKSLNQQEREFCIAPKLVGEIRWAGGLDQPPEILLRAPEHEDLMEKPEYKDRFWVWDEPDQNDAIEYYVSSDVSSGDGNDYTTATVYRMGYGGDPDIQVASWHGLINASHWAYVLAAIGIWYHTAEIACEFTGPGITTCNELYQTIDYPQIYRYRKLDSVHGFASTLLHWQTNSKTRPDAINRMFEALIDKSVILRDRHLIEEMRDFGRYEDMVKIAGIDNNDDLVMAAIIGITALRQKSRMSGNWMDSQPRTQSSTWVMPKSPSVFAIYDQLNRQIMQVDNEKEGHDAIAALSKKHSIDLSKVWRIVPIPVMKANTIFTPWLDSSGAERDLYDSHGLDGRDQMLHRDIVDSYRDKMVRPWHYQGVDDDD